MSVSHRNLVRPIQAKWLPTAFVAKFFLSLSSLSMFLLPMSVASAQQTGSVGDQAASQAPQGPELNQQASYIIGRQIISDFQKDDVAIDMDSLIQGIKDAAAGKESPLSPEQIQVVMTAFSKMITAQQQAKLQKLADDNLQEGLQFMKENQLKPGVKQLETGVQYQVITEGTGASPTETDTVTVHYVGTFLDGTKFDSSVDRGEPATFPLNQVIKGWTTTVPRMKVGSKWKLFIPANLAYGENGSRSIPPNKTLVFEIELLGIDK